MKHIFTIVLVVLFLFSFQIHVNLQSAGVDTDAVSAATTKPTPVKPTNPTTPAAPAKPTTPAEVPTTVPSNPTTPDTPVTWSSTPSIWAAAEIQQASSYGLTTAEVLGQYNKPITRLEFLQLTMKQYHASGGAAVDSADISQPFTDTTDSSVAEAYALGIIHGQGNGMFYPDSQLTRQEAAAIMFRAWKLLNAAEDSPVIYPRVFSDSAKISDWAKDAVLYMNQIGVVKGSSDGSVNPSGNATREEAILFVLRNYEANKAQAVTDSDQSTDATSSATANRDKDDDENDNDDDDDD